MSDTHTAFSLTREVYDKLVAREFHCNTLAMEMAARQCAQALNDEGFRERCDQQGTEMMMYRLRLADLALHVLSDATKASERNEVQFPPTEEHVMFMLLMGRNLRILKHKVEEGIQGKPLKSLPVPFLDHSAISTCNNLCSGLAYRLGEHSLYDSLQGSSDDLIITELPPRTPVATISKAEPEGVIARPEPQQKFDLSQIDIYSLVGRLREKEFTFHPFSLKSMAKTAAALLNRDFVKNLCARSDINPQREQLYQLAKQIDSDADSASDQRPTKQRIEHLLMLEHGMNVLKVYLDDLPRKKQSDNGATKFFASGYIDGVNQTHESLVPQFAESYAELHEYRTRLVSRAGLPEINQQLDAMILHHFINGTKESIGRA